MAYSWQTFVKLFQLNFPQFSGPGLMTKASPFYQLAKNSNNVFFGTTGIIIDGVFHTIDNSQTQAEVPPTTKQKRGPTGYNLYVNSHPKEERKAACSRWRYLQDNIQQTYKNIAAGDYWLAFYRLRAFTQDSSPAEHLSEFFMLSDELKNTLNQQY